MRSRSQALSPKIPLCGKAGFKRVGKVGEPTKKASNNPIEIELELSARDDVDGLIFLRPFYVLNSPHRLIPLYNANFWPLSSSLFSLWQAAMSQRGFGRQKPLCPRLEIIFHAHKRSVKLVPLQF